MRRQSFRAAIAEQLGVPLMPGDDPSLMLMVNDLLDNLGRQLARKSRDWGLGKTVMFSMLTDGFSPELLKRGYTRAALELLLERTKFRIRVLTKNSVIGSPYWTEFFAQHKDRFIVGLSIGTMDDAWARRIEIGTPPPPAASKRCT